MVKKGLKSISKAEQIEKVRHYLWSPSHTFTKPINNINLHSLLQAAKQTALNLANGLKYEFATREIHNNSKVGRKKSSKGSRNTKQKRKNSKT